ncbi:hepatocyte growth factor regulated tyrosine [Trichuris trichiura]|uniref:Hepatocyte growth factor-regulated tyrosine kinase substrate n=1 Tax=Trichuris trichiura TaxID=36087 RepID=A0A077Z4C0_TRITR|nr:hepatocyte growth factor regulated tyrosine [Trichuris trichiura]
MSKKFERLLDKATDSTLMEADWEMIMSCTDAVRSGEVPPKVALSSVRKRIHSDNPHVAHHALTVLEALVKNCGQRMHKEVATKEFMEDLKHLTSDCSDKVKDKILELIQCWAHAFRENPDYRIVKDTHNLMKLEGHVFPVLRESDAMFVSEAAPEWVDSNHCSRCRIQFTLITRKHHCRNCGEIFCDKCSSRNLPLPHIGIEKEVRCLLRLLISARKFQDEKSEAELQEEEELQLALALSQSEAEEKERLREPELVVSNETESELAHYLNRQYWEKVRSEQKQQLSLRQSPTPSAPVAVEADVQLEKELVGNAQNDLQNSTESLDDFMAALNDRLNTFVNRVKSSQARGRSVITDTTLQNTFLSLTSMHSQLLKHLQELDDRRGYFETLQDKVTQVRDAREAVEALRLEHEQKKEAEQYELQRMRHIQMVTKLEAMRIQKHEMLEQQRLAAIRKMEEEQLEMQMRKRMMPQQQYQVPVQGYMPGISFVQLPPGMYPYMAMGDPSMSAMMPPKTSYHQMNPMHINGIAGVPVQQQVPYAQPQYVMGGYVAPPLPQDAPAGYPYQAGFVGPASSAQYPMNPAAMTMPPVGYGIPAGAPMHGMPMNAYATTPPVNYGISGQQPAVPAHAQPAAPEQPLISFD